MNVEGLNLEGLNVVVAVGRLARPAELRVLPSGDRVVSIELTVPREKARAESVPVSWFEPPASASELGVDCDVAIVGYGPVGQTLAILLGQRGWRVGVLREAAGARIRCRARSTSTTRSARILQAAGVGDELRGAHRAGRHLRVAERRRRRRCCASSSRAAGALGMARGQHVRAARARAHRSTARARALPSVDGAARRRGRRARAHGASGVDARPSRADGGAATRSRRATSSAATAPTASSARSSASTVTDLGFFFDWLIVDVVCRTSRASGAAQRPDLRSGAADDAASRADRAGGAGSSCGSPARASTTSTARRPPGGCSRRGTSRRTTRALERHAVYTLPGALGATTWRRGRVLLAGDAAHQMPPFAGQGMCSGLRDAANLAWKLDLVLAGRGARRAARHLRDASASPHVRAVIDFSMALGKVICIADPAEAAARDAAMIAAAQDAGQTTPPPPLGSAPASLRAGDPHAGTALRAGPSAARRRRSGRFDDVVGRGWTLLSPRRRSRCAASTPSSAAFFASLGGDRGARRRRRRRSRDVDGATRAGSRARRRRRAAAPRLLRLRHRRDARRTDARWSRRCGGRSPAARRSDRIALAICARARRRLVPWSHGVRGSDVDRPPAESAPRTSARARARRAGGRRRRQRRGAARVDAALLTHELIKVRLHEPAYKHEDAAGARGRHGVGALRADRPRGDPVSAHPESAEDRP